MGSTSRASEAIKVCVRVRPMLPRELGRDEVVYYPTDQSNKLEVRIAAFESVCFSDLNLVLILYRILEYASLSI